MIDLINKISSIIAKKLSNMDGNFDNYDKYEFFIKAKFNHLLYTTIGVIISLIFNYFPFSLISQIVMTRLRKRGGGSHMKTNFQCQASTALSLFIVGMLSIYCYNIYLIFYLLSFSVFLTFHKVPVYTKNAKRHSQETIIRYKQEYKKNAFIITSLNFMIILLLYLGIEFINIKYLLFVYIVYFLFKNIKQFEFALILSIISFCFLEILNIATFIYIPQLSVCISVSVIYVCFLMSDFMMNLTEKENNN